MSEPSIRRLSLADVDQTTLEGPVRDGDLLAERKQELAVGAA